ncbi:response regulator transcription factor [Fontivita pretiosa]|uniref:response regulator transcription factor n=1 Tax=Fontivita pretiosa TaxID=2989684 RepID=UPI003D184580
MDDDATFRKRLSKALAHRGYEARDAANAEEAIDRARRFQPGRAVVDMRMPGRSGLQLVSDLVELLGQDNIDIIVLTGYGSIATAVEAMRRGAIDYLQKPCDAEQILAAFQRRCDQDRDPPAADAPGNPPADEPVDVSVPSLARVEWEHIQRVLNDCGGNISEAARRLRIHRRSLQRKLYKMQPSE